MALQTNNYRITRKHAGSPLLDFLSNELKLSKRAAKDLLDRRNVHVNGQRVWMARHMLQTGDVVSLPETVGGWIKERTTQNRKIPILWEDEHYLIADKPAGLLSAGAASLERRLQEQCRLPALRVVHRLDRDTSGCLILARSRADFDAIVPLFRARHINKTYHALVHGKMTKGEQRISKPLGGRTAVSHVRVLDSSPVASHLAIKIETGRTHQIRIHVASIRHPVLGDQRYRRQDEDTAELAAAVPRQMLHARTIQFLHPVTSQSVRAEAPLPADFKTCLRHLKLT